MPIIKFDSRVLRYHPSPLEASCVAIGVIVHDPLSGVCQVACTDKWAGVLDVDPDADTELLSLVGEDLHSRFKQAGAGGGELLRSLEDTLSLSLQLSPGVSIEAGDLASATEQLLRTYVHGG